MKCLIVMTFVMLYVSLFSCNKFNIDRCRRSSTLTHLICLTDEINDAIIWNEDQDVEPSDIPLENIHHSSLRLEFMHNGSIIEDRRVCNVDDRSHDCKFSFMDIKSDWRITWNTDVPMGPVFDARWEMFGTHMKLKSALPDYQPVTVNKNGVESNLIFERDGTLVVSIRGDTNANFLMCTESDYSKSFCYWIIIDGLMNATVLRKCQKGVSVYPKFQDCIELHVARKDNALSIHKWKTFVIMWSALTKSIKLYDPDVEILSYTDDDSKHDDFSSLHVLFGSPERGFRTRYRFHQYNYVFTTKPGAKYDSYKYKIEMTPTKEICIDIMIGLCASCELSIRLVDSADNTELAKKIISSSIPTQNIQHGLPMWQNVRIIAPNNNKKREFVMIKITTKSRNEHDRNHWAIGYSQQCLPEGTVKRIYISSNPVDYLNSMWPKATCQKLSYDGEHSQIIRSNMELMSPSDSVTVCPESRVGPKCNTVENQRMEESVKGFKIDNVTSTKVSVSWLLQVDPDDMICGYSLTMKALYRKDCVTDKSGKLLDVQSYNITNTTQSYTIQNLIPYVRYELTILAHHSQKDDRSSISFSTNATEIPTAVFQNLTYGKNRIKWSTRVADCSAVTGPLHATRLLFFGESANVKDFIDQYDSMTDSFILNETKKQNIYGCEKYRVRIHPLRDIDGKHNESVFTEIIFTSDPRAPDSPGAVDVIDMGKGMIDVDWKHPAETAGQIREFLIECKMISTNLTRGIWNFERHIISIYHIKRYQELHTTRLNLLPSTSYEMKISGVIECAKDILIGDPSRIDFETESSFAWYKVEPSYTIDMTNHSITLTLPEIDNMTADCEIYIVVIGIDLCNEIPTLSEPLARIIGLKNDEKAWHINSSLTSSSSSISIGSYVGYGNITNCYLVAGSTYKIAIVVSDVDIEVLNQTEPFVWRSKLIYMGLTMRHEFWAIPISLLFLIGFIFMIFYLKKSRKRPVKAIKKRTVHERIVKFERQLITPVYQEPSILYPAVSIHDQYLTPINTHLYEELKSKTLVELEKFEDYVTEAIASGELQKQFSLMSPGQVHSWEDGLLSDHANGDEYNDASAIDEMVVVLEDPNDPYFQCTNAHYIKGYNKDKAYIVLQGPQPNTNTIFWRVVWQERVEVICTISHRREDEQGKYNEYWPELDNFMTFENISVENISQTIFADYTFKIVEVKCNEEMRVINHLHYTAWPDYGIPLYTQSIVTYMKKLFEISSSEPVLVHCTVDLGRTGTLVLLDICHHRAISEGIVNVFDEAEKIRQQRANIVNTKQYIFAHVVLVDCLLTPTSAIMCDDSIYENIDEHRKRFAELQRHTDHCMMLNQMIQSLIKPELKLSENNVNKNRFTKSLPMTRLYLPRYPISDDESSYISGVYVDSARRRNSYIASQLPLPTTLTDFWRMIAAFKIELIIILQRPDIQDSTCCKFVPEPDEEIETHSFFSIEGKSISNGEYFFRQKIVLRDKSTESLSEQLVTILTCKEWDINGEKRLPIPPAVIDLYQTAERIANHDKPTVVMCYDGVTGCGLYLALSILLERINFEHECDVCFAIRAVRRSRSDFCHTQDQFEYLYNAASYYIAATEKKL